MMLLLAMSQTIIFAKMVLLSDLVSEENKSQFVLSAKVGIPFDDQVSSVTGYRRGTGGPAPTTTTNGEEK